MRPGLAVATVTGQLTVKDNSYSLGLVEEGGEAAELHSHQGEGRKRQIALPEIIYNLLRKQSSASTSRKNSKLLIFFCTNVIG